MTKKEKVQLWVDLLSYVLVGVGGFSFMTNHPDVAYAVTLAAGAVNKFAPKFFS